jgi:hypothetical protein
MILPPSPAQRAHRVRKTLFVDALYAQIRAGFDRIPDHRGESSTIPLGDALMSAFAMFALKDPSLLAFDQRRSDANMKRVFGIQKIPCDTQMRDILDPVNPDHLRPLFVDVFRQLQRGKALESYVFQEGYYLLTLDGTGYFSSQKIRCPFCLEKTNKKTGEVTCEHQLLGAVLVHPDHKEVLPLAPEPIQKQDGATKNDCERNASKRLLEKIRREHPRMKFIVVEDGLASNAPHIRWVQQLGMHFLFGAKPGDHTFLFARVGAAYEEERTISWTDGKVTHVINFVNAVPLNESNQDLLVNFLEYGEYDAEGNTLNHFTWITDLPITRDNARHLVRGARARWKIENETFNTLKNQGYHYEHNYGHGERHLCVVFAMLMMLAFLVDQVQQLGCPLFQAAWKKVGSKRALWDNLRSHFRHFAFQSMRQIYEAILYDLGKEVALPGYNTS